MSMLQKVIISAPFGNYIRRPGCTSTVGTFTQDYRGGKLYRIWRVLRTVRYYWRLKSWVNKLGLPNPGLKSHKGKFKEDEIISIHGFDNSEWVWLVAQCSYSNLKLNIEFNLSCPNVGHKPNLEEVIPAIRVAKDHGHTVIAKLPPIGWFEMVVELHRWGVTHFHCCNTLPTPGGGMSGKVLKPFSIEAVQGVRELFPDTYIIGGGGITCIQDAQDYLEAGANSVSVGSVLFFPWKWKLLNQLVEWYEDRRSMA